MEGVKIWVIQGNNLIKKKPLEINQEAFLIKSSGNVLLSHTDSHAVPSALKSLTSVFGKGTGVTSLP